jgi:hypothetical protein
MPYRVSKGGGSCGTSKWAVLNSATGKTMGCHSTKASADKQLTALNINVVAKEAGDPMPQPLSESTSLVEATTSANAGTGLLEVEFITPGWGSSGYYSPQVVEAAAPLFTVGTHMYFDHPTAAEDTERPQRSVRDLAAVITEAGHVDPASGGVRGTVQPLAPYRDLLTDEAFAMNVGLSIRGSATDITIGEAEGRRGPIIEGLSDIASVDFVTRAGRGGKVLQVLESARFVDEATADDRARQLSDTVRAAYPDQGVYAWVMDQDAERQVVWYQVCTDSGPSHTYEQTYDVADNDVDITLTGDPIEVSRVTRYVPVNPAGPTTTQESQEDTMPQIEEARLRELEEASGRVPTLESERDAAVQERDQARRELAESRARETATTTARTRVVAANATLPPATVDRIVVEATRSIPLTDAGQLDEAALNTAVDTARTAEEAYLTSLTGAHTDGKVVGFGASAPGEVTEATKPTTNAWGRPLAEIKGA